MSDDPTPDPIEKDPTLLSWVLPALKSRRTLKTWIRCCIAFAATLILMVSNKTLASMGQAGFFAAYVLLYYSLNISGYLEISSASLQ